jgi:hypothetical protein
MLNKMENYYKNMKFSERLNEYKENILVCCCCNILVKYVVSFVIYSIKIN